MIGSEARWTDERVEAVKKLWLEGLSASQVAKRLGGVTRNAVIGKVHRLGLSGRAKPSPPSRPPRSAPKRHIPPTASRPRPQVVTPPAPLSAAPSNEMARLSEPKRHFCKWPIGDPTSPAFGFCGAHSGKAVYCPDHTRRGINAEARYGSLSKLAGWIENIETARRGVSRDRGPWADAA